MPVQTFRKKPAVVQALQWTGDNAGEMDGFAGHLNWDDHPADSGAITVFTNVQAVASWKTCRPGDWVVSGENGLSVVEAGVFAEMYEPVEAAYEALREDVERVIRPRLQEVYRALRDNGIT